MNSELLQESINLLEEIKGRGIAVLASEDTDLKYRAVDYLVERKLITKEGKVYRLTNQGHDAFDKEVLYQDLVLALIDDKGLLSNTKDTPSNIQKAINKLVSSGLIVNRNQKHVYYLSQSGTEAFEKGGVEAWKAYKEKQQFSTQINNDFSGNSITGDNNQLGQSLEANPRYHQPIQKPAINNNATKVRLKVGATISAIIGSISLAIFTVWIEKNWDVLPNIPYLSKSDSAAQTNITNKPEIISTNNIPVIQNDRYIIKPIGGLKGDSKNDMVRLDFELTNLTNDSTVVIYNEYSELEDKNNKDYKAVSSQLSAMPVPNSYSSNTYYVVKKGSTVRGYIIFEVPTFVKYGSISIRFLNATLSSGSQYVIDWE
ncbi:hypothetical protein BWI93_05155 [Siphonobacter sp. BAB-5385]|uniref:hypothetical protein n=1 Tax=Siphonobacter sp. BAB-5385 TaxID=1864822 RepID=UPI000B9E6074|nr:hypothetical protein [Siphonobacter sp. BAB-5385]OZI09194.1 hypothetical protein BWI93_05155 [Siphonobacter sp. BAB-5385]